MVHGFIHRGGVHLTRIERGRQSRGSSIRQVRPYSEDTAAPAKLTVLGPRTVSELPVLSQTDGAPALRRVLKPILGPCPLASGKWLIMQIAQLLLRVFTLVAQSPCSYLTGGPFSILAISCPTMFTWLQPSPHQRLRD